MGRHWPRVLVPPKVDGKLKILQIIKMQYFDLGIDTKGIEGESKTTLRTESGIK